MKWLLVATVCVLAVDGAKQIVGNAYQYPLPGGGATTFIKGPAYANQIQSLAANGPLAGRSVLQGTVNSFTYAPHGTFAAQVNRVVVPQAVSTPLAPAHVSHGIVQPHPLVNRVVHHYPAPNVVVSSPRVLSVPGPQISIRSPQTVAVQAPRLAIRVPQVVASPQRFSFRAPQQVIVNSAPQVFVSNPRITVARNPNVVVSSPRVLTAPAPVRIVPTQVVTARAPQITYSAPRVVSVPAPRVTVSAPQISAAPAPQIAFRPAQATTVRAPQIAISAPRVIANPVPQIAVSAPRVFSTQTPRVTIGAQQVFAAPAPQVVVRRPPALAIQAPRLTLGIPRLTAARVPQITVRNPQIIAARPSQVTVGAPQLITARAPVISLRAPQIIAARAPPVTIGAQQILAAPAPRVTVSSPQIVAAPQFAVNAPRLAQGPISQVTLSSPRVFSAPQVTVRAPQVISAPAQQVVFTSPRVISAQVPQQLTVDTPRVSVSTPQVYSAPAAQITLSNPQVVSAPRVTVRAPQVVSAPAPRVVFNSPRVLTAQAPQQITVAAPRVTVSQPQVISVPTPSVAIRTPQLVSAPTPQVFISSPRVFSAQAPQQITVSAPRLLSAPGPQIAVSSPQIIGARAPQISFFSAPRSLRPAITSFIGSAYLANNYLPQRSTLVTPVTRFASQPAVFSVRVPSATVVGTSQNLRGNVPALVTGGGNTVVAPGISSIRLNAPTNVVSGLSVNLGPRTVTRQSVPITGISSSVFTKLVHVPATTAIVSNGPAINSIVSSNPTSIGISAPSGLLRTSVTSSAPLANTYLSSPSLVGVASPLLTAVHRATGVGAIPVGSVARLSTPAVTSANNVVVARPLPTTITSTPSIVALSPGPTRITTLAGPNQIIAQAPLVSRTVSPVGTNIAVQPRRTLVASVPGAVVTQVSGLSSASPALSSSIPSSGTIVSSVPVRVAGSVLPVAAPRALVTTSVTAPQQLLTPAVTQIRRAPTVIAARQTGGGVIVSSSPQITRVSTQTINPSVGLAQVRPALGASVVGSSPQFSTVSQISRLVSTVSAPAGLAQSNVALTPAVSVIGGSLPVSGTSSSYLTKLVQVPVSSTVLGPMYSQQLSVGSASPSVLLSNQNNILFTGPGSLLKFIPADAVRIQTLGPAALNSNSVSRNSIGRLTPTTVLTGTSVQSVPVVQSNQIQPVTNAVTVSQGAVNQALLPVSVTSAQSRLALDNIVRSNLPRNLLTGYTVPVVQNAVRLTSTSSAIPPAPVTVQGAVNVVSAETAGSRPGSGYVNREINAPIAARLTSSVQSTNTITEQRSNLHEIHIGGDRKSIRVEEYKTGPQVIRVHDGPRSPPQVLNVEAPQEQQDIVRIVSKEAGPPHVERVVHDGGTQVFDVQKPAAAPERIVHIERGPPTPPRVELTQEQPQVVAATPAVAATQIASPPVAVTVREGAPLLSASRVRASPLARIAAAPVVALDTNSASEKIVVRKLVPAGTFGTRLRRRKLTKAATSR
ncbi:mucin-17-like [Galendromus occidentalis]|uniref:Mucin-17-like n=1 Tax=Galendromus occidentalis TaxID=34638 RepID=A0AAJ7L8F9_9ACAR|nr:mucin-17-like [Galendromus occidentalis]